MSQITFATAVKRGQIALAGIAKSSWQLGDIALSVKPEYGDATVSKLAQELDMNPNTLANFRTCAAAYDASERDTGNSFTVYNIFAGEDDRMELLADHVWTVAEARAFLKGDVAGDDSDSDGEGSDQSEDDAELTLDEQIANAASEVMRLEGELAKANAKLAKLEAAKAAEVKRAAKPAAKRAAKLPMLAEDGTPAVKQAAHVFKGIPSHDAGANRADCPACKLARSQAARAAKTTPAKTSRRAA